MNRVEWDDAALREEADHFHQALFRSPVPPIVADRYVRFHHICLSCNNPAEKITAERIVRLGLDAEAIEYAFRLRGQKHLLTKKFQTLVYLVEVRSDYYSFFFSEHPAPVKSILRLIASIWRALCKAAAGELLIRRRCLD